MTQEPEQTPDTLDPTSQQAEVSAQGQQGQTEQTQVSPSASSGLSRPRLTLAEAAQAARVSRETIKRRRLAGSFPNAEKVQRDGVETWVVPVEDLLAAGFRLHAPTQADQGQETGSAGAPQVSDPSYPPKIDPGGEPRVTTLGQATEAPGSPTVAAQEVAALARELEQVRSQIAEERRRRELAELEARESRAKLAVHEEYAETFRAALRLLEAGRPIAVGEHEASVLAEAPRRRRWLRREP